MTSLANMTFQHAGKLFAFSCPDDAKAAERYILITGIKTTDEQQLQINFPETIGGIPVKALKISQYLGYTPATIRIPKTVETIDLSGGFPHVSESLEIDQENPFFYTDGISIIARKDNVLQLMCKELVTYSVPDGVEVIGFNAFKFMPLQEVFLPDSVHTLSGGAFAYCNYLKTVRGGNGIVKYETTSIKDTPWFQKSEILVLGKTLVRHEVKSTHIVIPEGIEIIGPNAIRSEYEKRGVLESLVLPPTVRIIGESAIQGNISLTELALPEGLEVIGNHAFSGCEGLKQITIPACVKHIGLFAFSDCKELERVNVSGLFSGSKEAKIWNCPVQENTISAGLFCGCISLKEFRIPEGIQIIGESAFSNCALQSIHLPDSLLEIGSKAFAECFFLETLRLPRNLSVLGELALPTSTTGWHSQNAQLQEVSVDEANASFRSENGILCSVQGEMLYCPGRLSVAEFTIPPYVTSIRSNTFLANESIRKLIVPETVSKLDDEAFSGMTALEELVFTGTREALGKALFRNCRNLKQITWPQGLKTIGKSCFENTGLEQLSIPESVEFIDSYAFSVQTLKSATLPKTVQKIGLSIFAHVKDITVYDTIDAQAKPAEKYLDSNNGFFNGKVGSIGIAQRENYVVGACNSNWYEHTITVRSAETGAIKYSVRMPYNQKRKVYCSYASAWGRNAQFHFPAIDALFKELTADAKQDYALCRIRQWDQLNDEMKDTLSKYIARNAKDLAGKVMESDDAELLERMEYQGIVKKNTLDERMDQAQRYGAAACKAWLLEWQNKNFSQKEKVKKIDQGLKMRAPTVAELKKIWPNKKGSDGGLIITGYNGRDVDVVVPEVIGKTPVTAIQSLCFSENKDPQQQTFLREQLRSVVIPDSVNSIGYMAFCRCAALESVQLPQKLSELSSSLFLGCSKLVVSLPKQLKTISSHALSGVANEVFELPSRLRDIDREAFFVSPTANAPSGSLKEFRVHPKNASFKVVDGVLFSADGTTLICYPYARESETYTVPEGVTAIGYGAFYCNRNLKHITLSDKVVRIGDRAFSGCTSLETIDLPGKIDCLGINAFCECTSLREITVPGGIDTLPYCVFASCTSLKTVHLPDTIQRIDNQAFARCSCLTDVTIPEGLKGLGNRAFDQCTALECLIFSDKVTNIPYDVFRGCGKLTLHVPANSKLYDYAKNNKIKVVIE